MRRAFAAGVGEPGGAQSVFDLALEASGPECVVCRLDATPGEAPRVARAIELGVGRRQRATPALAHVAHDG